MSRPFPTDPHLTAAGLAYKPPRLIAEQALPVRPVGKREFKYIKRTRAEDYSIPDVLVARTSRPGLREFTATETKDSTIDFGLDSPIPSTDKDEAPPGYDPEVIATIGLTRVIKLNQEKRCADVVFNTANYAAGNSVTLSGTSKWSDYGNSNPVTAIMQALEVPFERPNKMIIGRAPYATLRQHPKMVKAVFGADGSEGVVTKDQIARLFELEDVLIGEAQLNVAKEGQPESYARVWGNACALVYTREEGAGDETLTFGFTAQWGTFIAGVIDDKHIGLRGGRIVRAGQSIKEVICAPDLGYIFQTPV